MPSPAAVAGEAPPIADPGPPPPPPEPDRDDGFYRDEDGPEWGA